MSAECQTCGADLVGYGNDMYCEECKLRAEIERLRQENNRLHTECGHREADVAELRRELAVARAEIQRAVAHWESLRWLSNTQEKPASGVPIDHAMAAAVNTIIRLQKVAETWI